MLAQRGLGVLEQDLIKGIKKYKKVNLVYLICKLELFSIIFTDGLPLLVIKMIITSALPCLAKASSFSFQRSVRKARREERRACNDHNDHGDVQGDDHDGEGDDHNDHQEEDYKGVVTFCAASSFLEDSR